MLNDQYNSYQKANETASEITQVIMLYEGAINFIEQAKEAILNKDFEKRYNLINRAIAIITGLNSCLNFNEQTESVASALDQYYQAIDMRLLYIQCDNSLKSCNEVIDDLKVMLNAWKDVARETAENKTIAEMQEQAPPAPLASTGSQIDVEITV
ncbi:MAG: fliS [Rickettsiaceae bacterium]|jgi:flagellar protein FliS|nr:fliS [Rickettsiaceae bacterium]